MSNEPTNPHDQLLRDLIGIAQKEWDIQDEMPDEEIERLRKGIS